MTTNTNNKTRLSGSRFQWDSLAVLALLASAGMVAPVVSADSDTGTELRELSTFNSIKFSLPADIELIQGDTHSVTISADQQTLADIVTEVEGGVLHIYRRNKRWWTNSSRDILVVANFKQLNVFHLAGSGNASASVLDTDKFKITVSGSGSAAITSLNASEVTTKVSGSGELIIEELHADRLNQAITGSGDISTAGRVREQRLAISGSGDAAMSNLESDTTTVKIAGSGDAEVNAQSKLAVHIAGSGEVLYRGSPEITKRIAGSGELIPLKD